MQKPLYFIEWAVDGPLWALGNFPGVKCRWFVGLPLFLAKSCDPVQKTKLVAASVNSWISILSRTSCLSPATWPVVSLLGLALLRPHTCHCDGFLFSLSK